MNQKRRAVTLIELTAALTVLSLLWLAVTSVLYSMHRANHRLRIELQQDQAFDRFSIRLRRDAHEASSASINEEPDRSSELVLSAAQATSVHYGASVDGFYRVVRKGDSTVHQDEFRTGNATSGWELDTSGNSTMIVLTLTSNDKQGQSITPRKIKASVATVKPPVVHAPETSL